MRSSTVISLALAIALSSASALSAQMPGVYPPPPPQIVTSARGEAFTQPDRATIMFQVETRGATAAEAGAVNARRQRAVLDTLRKLGFTNDQLSTLGFNVHPERRFDREAGRGRITGYIAMNTIRVDVRRLELVGPAIDAALSRDASTISNLQFFSSRFDEARREALGQAVNKARADAEAMARAAGGSLGPLLEVTSQFFERPMMEMQMARGMATDAAQTPINPGEQTVNVTVMARWQFAQGR